jgi:hypothetical protein
LDVGSCERWDLLDVKNFRVFDKCVVRERHNLVAVPRHKADGKVRPRLVVGVESKGTRRSVFTDGRLLLTVMEMASWILGGEEDNVAGGATGGENEEVQNEEGDEQYGDEKFLTDSGITSPTEQGSVASSEEDLFTPSSWLGGLGADFKNLASSLKETAGGVVGFVHRSAMNVASEIRELEEVYSGSSKDGTDETMAPLRLPWEVLVEDPNGAGKLYREDGELKQKIFLLSSQERSFLTPFSSNDVHAECEESFVLDEPRIQLIRHLLEVDENLALSHARLSGRSHVSESMFWRNYFHHCEQARLARENEDVHFEEDNRVHDQGGRSRTKSDDDSSYVCVNTDVMSPPSSLNWSGMVASSDGDLVVLGTLPSTANPDAP